MPSRECQRWYKPTVARLLELHHWGLASKRVTLTEITNDRTGEWTSAYERPADCAFPIALSTLATAGALTYYQGLSGLLAMYRGQPAFQIVGNTLYTRYSGELDYVSYDITEAQFNATFENVVELTLAAAMCFAILKNKAREQDLRQQATSAINIAIAQSLNAGHHRYGDEYSDRDYARGADWQLPWDWWPGATAA